MEPEREHEELGLKTAPQARPGELIVRADEVDEVGAIITNIPPMDDGDLGSPIDPDLVIGADGTTQQLGATASGTIRSPVRPILRREAAAPPPPPPRQPPPPAPPAQSDNLSQTTDSLSLGQLRNLVANIPKLEPIAYGYNYDDTRSFPEELEEWFQYTEEDREVVEEARNAFEDKIKHYSNDTAGISEDFNDFWLELSEQKREDFVQDLVDHFDETDSAMTLKSLSIFAYLAMGVWGETCGKRAEPEPADEYEFEPPNEKYRKAVAQLNCIHQSTTLLCRLGALPKIFDVIRHICDQDLPYDPSHKDKTTVHNTLDKEINDEMKKRQLNMALTTTYFLLESGRRQPRRSEEEMVRQAFVDLEPNFLEYLSGIVAKIRWEDECNVALTKLILILWKSLLLIFGDSSLLEDCKKLLCNYSKEDESVLTTSPLDYHVFRQEITSKYPAYNPPPPLIPLEINNNSILPPQPSLESRVHSQDNLHGLGKGNLNGGSIFHQPVHIATPAPSPPPSPAGPGGKAGKKQNYQTNQNFPFLYPPLDSSSNDLGGKGKTEMQDKLVGKKWEGGDVPASIIEAGQLFASRMRMSRALQQLWDVREQFVRFERGWENDLDRTDADQFNLDEELNKLFLGSSESDSDEKTGNENIVTAAKQSQQPAQEAVFETEDPVTRARLEAVESYFRRILPQLQSIVIVLLKVLLSNVTILGTVQNGQNGLAAPTDIDDSQHEDQILPKSNINLVHQITALAADTQPISDPAGTPSLEELNAIRTQEITSKAISGFLLMMLKWFRVSHVLKFEYATQILLDSNYIPLALKYFALQDIDKAVDLRHDRVDLDFFQVCHELSGNPQDSDAAALHERRTSSSSIDSAAPPPIARYRASNPSSTSSSPPPSPGSPGSPSHRPEVDELGYPTTAIPPQPLTTYAPRFFFTYITTLRLLQKLTKGHAHRALLLVQYKSSTILRKALKVPQPSLRLYTLKLFKTQVPFCGRKWRQANMRVITAIYVFCRMGLRDDWISGGGQIEELVDGALGVESAWRGLVGWWLARRYRAAVTNAGAAARGSDEALARAGGLHHGVAGANCGEDFFAREIEKLGWGWGVEAADDDDDGEGVDWDGGPLELDGW